MNVLQKKISQQNQHLATESFQADVFTFLGIMSWVWGEFWVADTSWWEGVMMKSVTVSKSPQKKITPRWCHVLTETMSLAYTHKKPSVTSNIHQTDKANHSYSLSLPLKGNSSLGYVVMMKSTADNDKAQNIPLVWRHRARPALQI